MRLGTWFSSAACLVFTSSLAVTYRQDTLAEQAFKNIKVLKGKKASDIVPAMQFFDASLKVDCDYCHTADRSSDEKEEKNTAREMILMQNDINEKNFRGRLVVTCATCHAGHTRPVNLPPVMGIEVRPRRSTDLTVEQIMDQYNKAAGTAATSHPFRSVALSGSSEDKGVKAPVHILISGNKFHIDTDAKTRFQHIGFNGTDLWFQSPNGPITVPPEHAAAFINQELIAMSPATLPQLTKQTAGTAKIGDRDMLVVSGTIDGSNNRAAIYFDKSTGLPARVVYTYPTILGSIPQVNDYSDYRKIDGVEIPTTVAHHSAEEDIVLHFNSVKVNGKFDETLFDPKK